MDALSNARITVNISSESIQPFTPPKATHSRSGVSVEYAPDPDKHWLALRTSYGRTDRAADLLIESGHYVYVARRYEYRMVDGRRRRELRNLIPNILFAYLSRPEAEALLSHRVDRLSPIPELPLIASFYYNHFVRDAYGKNPPLEIPANQMQHFINITRSQDDNLVYVSNDSIVHVKTDDHVYVRDGKFRGCMGVVVRVAGQQRVGLRLADLGWVATAYVPTAFLQLISKDEYEAHVNDNQHDATDVFKTPQ